jgi:hypothetical protein
MQGQFREELTRKTALKRELHQKRKDQMRRFRNDGGLPKDPESAATAGSLRFGIKIKLPDLEETGAGE